MKSMIVFKNGVWFSWEIYNILKRNFFGKMPVTTVQMLKTGNFLPAMQKEVEKIIFL